MVHRIIFARFIFDMSQKLDISPCLNLPECYLTEDTCSFQFDLLWICPLSMRANDKKNGAGIILCALNFNFPQNSTYITWMLLKPFKVFILGNCTIQG